MSTSKDRNFTVFEENSNLKNEFFKYLYYWKFFLMSSVLFLIVAFTILRYSPKVYNTKAKILIIDKKQTSLELPSASELFSNSQINLENEMEILMSYPVLSEVIKNKNLQISVFAIGKIMRSLRVDYPFDITSKISSDSLSKQIYRLNMTDQGFEVINKNDESKSFSFNSNSSLNYNHDLPFEVFNFNKQKFIENGQEGYEIQIFSIADKVKSLKNTINVSQIGKNSDIIEIDFSSTSSKYAKLVLNELVNVFDNDGIRDRQLVHKRTIQFVNERYAYLSMELQS